MVKHTSKSNSWEAPKKVIDAIPGAKKNELGYPALIPKNGTMSDTSSPTVVEKKYSGHAPVRDAFGGKKAAKIESKDYKGTSLENLLKNVKTNTEYKEVIYSKSLGEFAKELDSAAKNNTDLQDFLKRTSIGEFATQLETATKGSTELTNLLKDISIPELSKLVANLPPELQSWSINDIVEELSDPARNPKLQESLTTRTFKELSIEARQLSGGFQSDTIEQIADNLSKLKDDSELAKLFAGTDLTKLAEQAKDLPQVIRSRTIEELAKDLDPTNPNKNDSISKLLDGTGIPQLVQRIQDEGLIQQSGVKGKVEAQGWHNTVRNGIRPDSYISTQPDIIQNNLSKGAYSEQVAASNTPIQSRSYGVEGAPEALKARKSLSSGADQRSGSKEPGKPLEPKVEASSSVPESADPQVTDLSADSKKIDISSEQRKRSTSSEQPIALLEKGDLTDTQTVMNVLKQLDILQREDHHTDQREATSRNVQLRTDEILASLKERQLDRLLEVNKLRVNAQGSDLDRKLQSLSLLARVEGAEHQQRNEILRALNSNDQNDISRRNEILRILNSNEQSDQGHRIDLMRLILTDEQANHARKLETLRLISSKDEADLARQTDLLRLLSSTEQSRLGRQNDLVRLLAEQDKTNLSRKVELVRAMFNAKEASTEHKLEMLQTLVKSDESVQNQKAKLFHTLFESDQTDRQRLIEFLRLTSSSEQAKQGIELQADQILANLEQSELNRQQKEWSEYRRTFVETEQKEQDRMQREDHHINDLQFKYWEAVTTYNQKERQREEDKRFEVAQTEWKYTFERQMQLEKDAFNEKMQLRKEKHDLLKLQLELSAKRSQAMADMLRTFMGAGSSMMNQATH